MHVYVTRRLLLMIPVALAVTLLVFLMLHLAPGDPAYFLAGPRATPELIRQIRTQYGLDLPLHQQYWMFLSGLLRGDMGWSMTRHQPVSGLVRDAVPITLELAAAGTLIAVAMGIPLGIAAAVRAGSWIDQGVMVLAVTGISIPAFWTGIMMMYLFGVYWGILPTSGHGTLAHLVMPAMAQGAINAALLSRVTRSSMLEVISQDYIRTARAKGLTERVVIYKHALKNAIMPTITVLGMQVGYILGGALVLEVVFARPGMGRLLVMGIYQRDYAVVQMMLLVLALGVMGANFAVDLIYAYLNPKIRFN
ncbi:MAG: ABC transporter permease [Bacillota bacterium]